MGLRPAIEQPHGWRISDGERRHADRPSRSEVRISNQHERWGQTVERAWESSVADQKPSAGAGFYSRLFWEGDSLAFECGSKGADDAWSMLWRYELLESGQRLRAVEQMRGHSGDCDNTWIFE